MNRAKIVELSVYHPAQVVTNAEIENRVNTREPMLPEGSLHRLFGIRERRFAEKDEQVSDIAVKAAKPIIEKYGAQHIDFLIFAAACADLIEPATSNIVQSKLKLRCPCIDVKNACNSFTSALMVANSLIVSGTYQNILVVNGEKLSDAIRFNIKDEAQLRRGLAAFSLGDAGAAALLSGSDDESGICYQKFMTRGDHWELCTIKGGGSMYPRDLDKYYFEGQTVALKDVLTQEASRFFQECLDEAGWALDEIQHLFTHQVSTESTRWISKKTGVPLTKIEEAFPLFGNTAAASIPLSIHQRMQKGMLKKGDKIALLGLAAGVSVSVQLLIW
ncbi:MAG: 3-oxoacyl-ACP synthase III family protein [Saprospiraceae bacterium]